jgi:hypothetical protein
MAKRKSSLEKLILFAAKELIRATKANKSKHTEQEVFKSLEDHFYITAGDVNYLEPPDEYIELRTYSDSFTYPVSGESYQTATYLEISRMFPGETEVQVDVLLVPYPENPVSRHAVAVTFENMMLGYIPSHVSKEFADYLGKDCGKCRARIFLDRPEYSSCSVEINIEYPLTAVWEEYSEVIRELGGPKPLFNFSQLRTNYVALKKIHLSPGESRIGCAYLNDGYSTNPWIQDCDTLEEIGQPDPDISWAFNVFCRAYGGQVKVRYKLSCDLNGELNLKLDSTAFKNSNLQGTTA